MEKNMSGAESREKVEYAIVAVLSILMYLILMWILTGNGLFSHNTYNSYALQAESWCKGRLDLGQNYSFLELAFYKGKYYVSFPPFPSYLLLPFALFLGSNTPDFLLLWMADVVTVLYLYKLALSFKLSPKLSALTAVFVMLGTNVTFNMLNPWVWFWAQTLCFMLAVMAVYYAYRGKGGWALFFWACSVGCRPMQALYVPVLLVILFRKEREKFPERSFFQILWRRIYWAIPAGVVAASYMILNFLRFDNPFEFGHNYLPEFVEAEHGQFSLFYLSNNWKMLWHGIQFDEEGRMIIDHFGNLNFMIVSPFVIFALCMLVCMLLKRQWRTVGAMLCVLALSAGYLLVTMLHRTMGGWHFGNRYTNDILPWIYLTVVWGLSREEKMGKYQVPLAVFGMCLSAVGLVIVYNGL